MDWFNMTQGQTFSPGQRIIKVKGFEKADKTAEAVALKGELDNRNQTATILNSLGRFVAWAGSGAQTMSAASAG